MTDRATASLTGGRTDTQTGRQWRGGGLSAQFNAPAPRAGLHVPGPNVPMWRQQATEGRRNDCHRRGRGENGGIGKVRWSDGEVGREQERRTWSAGATLRQYRSLVQASHNGTDIGTGKLINKTSKLILCFFRARAKHAT